MSKLFKSCLIFLGVISLIIVLIFAIIYYTVETSDERANKDMQQQEEICHKKLEVPPNSILYFKDFKKSEINNFKIQLIRNNKIIKNDVSGYVSIDENKNISLSIPFEFLKTDIVVLQSNKNLFFELSNFKLQTNAEQRWTAMGYNGLFEPCGCDLESFRLNKNDSTSIILKKNGLKNNSLLK